MIGYYVHHVGAGHLHRATALARVLDVPVTGLSSLARPSGWRGPWVQLPRDDHDPAPSGVDAHGRLHWVPVGDAGLRGRMARVAAWIDEAAPSLLVSDVSVEVTLLARLHGVRVLGVVLPGDRGDAAHRLGLDVCDALVGLWPEGGPDLATGLTDAQRSRLHPVGALSRFPVADAAERRPGPRRVTVLAGRGGAFDPALLDAARAQAPDWAWTILGGDTWVDDPWQAVREADVVLTHAGQNALAEVAAARRPAVVVPQQRPHAEQTTTATVLAEGDWPVVVEPTFPGDGWADRLDRAAALDGSAWARWCDGHAAERFAGVVRSLLPARPQVVSA
jgi:hypothetical protein